MSSPEQGGNAPDPELMMQCMCPGCTQQFLYAQSALEVDEVHYAISFGCANCDWTGAGIFGDEELERFDEVLDSFTADMVSLLKALTNYNREQEIEAFVKALAHDAIDADDFRIT